MGRCQISASRQNCRKGQNCTKVLLHRDACLKLDKEKKRVNKLRKGEKTKENLLHNYNKEIF